jgi:uncharacterized protein YbaA (DUF1428 family)
MSRTAAADRHLDETSTSMSLYIDGFVIPVPAGRIGDYRQLASLACEVWLDHGAIDYRECVGDDLEAGQCTSFRALAGCKEDETVVFAWITYASREQRDAVNAAVMKDPRMAAMMDPAAVPFDCKRMAFGGFTTLVSATRTP